MSVIRDDIAGQIAKIIEGEIAKGRLFGEAPKWHELEVLNTKSAEHGDYSCNWAMVAIKSMAAQNPDLKSPRDLAQMLAMELEKSEDFEKIEVAGPGFLNMTLAVSKLAQAVCSTFEDSSESVLTNQHHFGRPKLPKESCQRINLEYVSVNPNGPITIGSGRGAAYGSALANILQACGHTIHREYYINDGVNSEQMRLFAESVKASFEGRLIPENGYKGDYVMDVARLAKSGLRPYIEDTLKRQAPSATERRLLPFLNQALDSMESGSGEVPIEVFQAFSQDRMIEKQRADLEAFGTVFDTWFSEQSLHDSGLVQKAVQKLVEMGVADTRNQRFNAVYNNQGELISAGIVRQEEQTEDDAPGSQETIWLRSTLFGDDLDRVLKRRDGRMTYIASDVVYHEDKFNRPSNADKLMTILGPDHHGYINRLHSVVAALLLDHPEVQSALPDHDLTEAEAVLFKDSKQAAQCQVAQKISQSRLKVMIFQLVRFVKDGKPAPMRKRDGNIYALIDLVTEIGERVKPKGTREEKLQAGRDVSRFFYLMRNHDTTFDFNLDLAEKQSDENPVFYVQYAHARTCSVIAKAQEAGLTPQFLTSEIHPKERALILKVFDLAHEVKKASEDYGVNRLATYAVELARTYHNFYDSCRVINVDDLKTSEWRLALCHLTRAGLKGALDLLGISCPEKMERESTHSD